MPILPPPVPVDEVSAIVYPVGQFGYSFGGTYGDAAKAVAESAASIRQNLIRRAAVQVVHEIDTSYESGPSLRSFKVQMVKYRYLGRGEPPAYDFSEYDEPDE